MRMGRLYHSPKNSLSVLFCMLVFLGPSPAMDYEYAEILRANRRLSAEEALAPEDNLPFSCSSFFCCFPCPDWFGEERANLFGPQNIRVWNEEKSLFLLILSD
jgi:hypothetical protein